MTTVETARNTFERYGIDVSTVRDESLVRAYDSIVMSAIAVSRPPDYILQSLRSVIEFSKQPRIDPKWNLNLNELL